MTGLTAKGDATPQRFMEAASVLARDVARLATVAHRSDPPLPQAGMLRSDVGAQSGRVTAVAVP
jgi:hypothetical protein